VITTKISNQVFLGKESDILTVCSLLDSPQLELFQEKQVSQWTSYREEITTLFFFLLLAADDLRTFEILCTANTLFIKINLPSLVAIPKKSCSANTFSDIITALEHM